MKQHDDRPILLPMRLYDAEECGPDGYPPEWHRSIKYTVRGQAEDRCVRCGHPYAPGSGEWSRCDERCTHGGPVRLLTPEGDVLREGPFDQTTDLAPIREAYPTCTIQAGWRILTVHHLDGNKANCRWWNLAALCQRCHLTIQGKVRMERVWPWEHSDWFKPYVAGYYALTYLGQEIGRDEAEERLDELLALERAA